MKLCMSEINLLYGMCSENKGIDQMCSYGIADRLLCFGHMNIIMQVFSLLSSAWYRAIHVWVCSHEQFFFGKFVMSKKNMLM